MKSKRVAFVPSIFSLSVLSLVRFCLPAIDTFVQLPTRHLSDLIASTRNAQKLGGRK
jgi:hypothetical protein